LAQLQLVFHESRWLTIAESALAERGLASKDVPSLLQAFRARGRQFASAPASVRPG
jgi:hypothetical protein